MGELAKIEGDGLTEKQRAFVEALVVSGDVKDAMALAGYAEGTNPATVTGGAAVQRAIDRACRERLFGTLQAKAWKTLEDLLDAPTPAATRMNAAKFIAEQRKESDGTDKPLIEMTEAELMAVIEKAEKVRSGVALIDVTPTNGALNQRSAPRPIEKAGE